MELNTDTVWKPLISLPHILVSLEGQVYDTRRNKKVPIVYRTCEITGNTSPFCNLVGTDGKRYPMRLARIVYSAFREVVLDTSVAIGYYNGDYSDVNIWNLFAYPKAKRLPAEKFVGNLQEVLIDF